MTYWQPDDDPPPSIQQLSDVQRWYCPNCGQHIFTPIDEEPPEVCAYCEDMTTWQLVEGGG